MGTKDVARAWAVYDPILAVIGIRLMKAHSAAPDYGVDTLLISIETPADGESAKPGNGVYIAFATEDWAMVGEFHRTALANGGSNADTPGPRPIYDAHYYSAFVREPDSNKIEAVTYSGK